MKNSKFFYEQYLWSIALSTAIDNGYYFGIDCELDFKNGIRIGVIRLMRQKDFESKDALLLAKENTINLVKIDKIAKK